jgi:NADH dehydrogenase [ubiquinone] 1 alpha subcomplex assembly factor 7
MSVTEILARRIAIQGPITVSDYMAEALGHPRFGYYTTRDPFGAAGDFITAPEISQMFGELIGLWCADLWLRMGRPAPLRLIELGPGRGTLMADMLRAFRSVADLSRSVRIHLVETSPVLRSTQARTLAGFEPAWHDRLSEVPDGPSIIVANELFDALPIRQFQMTPDGWRERLVDLAEEEGRFRFVLSRHPDPIVALIPRELDRAPVGSVAELCPLGLSLAAEIGRRAAAGGAGLIVDYGYDRPGTGSTLQAVLRHAFADPLVRPGEADLTAHVDFRALGDSGRAAGALVAGPVGQGRFLRALGIAERAATLKKRATAAQAADIDAALARLTEPDQMGTLFKAMAFVHPGLGEPAGFA